MQSTSVDFVNHATKDLREVDFGVLMSFPKVYNASITRAQAELPLTGPRSKTIYHTSVITQEWDKYTFSDFTDRVITIEWTRSVELFSSVVAAMADIVLDNTDDYFTPGAGSAINDYILPYRPIRIYAGWQNKLVPVFIGVTEKMPVIDENAKTATFHCVDFLYTLYNRPLDESVMYTGSRVDQILEGLFGQFDILPTQLDLDQANSTPPYAFFPKGMKLIEALTKLMQAEQGRLFMDEEGVITFKNRQNYSNTAVMNFNMYDSIKDIATTRQDDIINVIEIQGQIREVQPNQPYWEASSSIEVPPNDSVDVWAEFNDPVSTVDDPVYATSALTSSFSVNSASDGSGTDDAVNVTLTASDILGGTTFKMTFTNASAGTLYITALKLYATPIPVIKNLYIREQTDSSVAKYDERILSIQNDLFQDETDAQSFAIVVLADYPEVGKPQEIDVKGSPALQIDDTIRINNYDNIDDYKITKIVNKINYPINFEQRLQVKAYEPIQYFTIGVSMIGGTDQIHP